MKKYLVPLLIYSVFSSSSSAGEIQGKAIYEQRCAICHGADAKGTGLLAKKSNPPTPDLTSKAFQQRLANYPGVIVASVVLRPNGTLIPDTLKANGIKLPAHTYTDQELRDLNNYMLRLLRTPK